MEKQVISLKNKHVECLLMVECGYKIKFFGEDALTAAKILNYGLEKTKASKQLGSQLIDFLYMLVACSLLDVVLVLCGWQTETASIHKAASKTSGKMFERKCSNVHPWYLH